MKYILTIDLAEDNAIDLGSIHNIIILVGTVLYVEVLVCI